MLGWLLNIDKLKAVLPGLATMKANTACGFLFAGAALWMLHTSKPGSRGIRVARALAVIVAMLGIVSLAEYFCAINIGIDQLIISDDPHVPFPGRMSPATATDFIFIGIALFCLKLRDNRLSALPQWILIPSLFISTLAVVGYAFSSDSLYKIGPFTSMALHTALSFLFVSLAILAADSAHGFAKIATSDTTGGLVSRRLLPTLPIMIFGLACLHLEGERAGLYDFHFGLSLMVLLSMTICLVSVAFTVAILHKTDLERARNASEIVNLNMNLERTVLERTRQLKAANVQLEELSLEDSLTNLANRRFFDRYLEAQVAVARRNQRTLALIICDVDSFKAYNDNYGHQAGDDCLKRVAAAIRSCCRRPADLAARYGGEEFAMILPETDMVGAIRIAEDAREAVAQLRIPHDHSLAATLVSISGGVAIVSGTIDFTAERLIAAADQTLYQAKRLGRNRMLIAAAESSPSLPPP
jgi:diguanylate cyclase (GGDEF)-like protein